MKTFVPANEVREGDVLCFGNPQSEVTIERLSVAECDGAIGLHGNNETWSAWYKPTDRVRIAERAALDLHGGA